MRNRNNLMMVPHLTLIIHPSIKTGSGYVSYVSSGLNCFELNFDRNRLIKFFKDLIYQNTSLQICYSFNVPSTKSKNRFLANEVPISFACLLSFAEAAAYKDVPIYLYPLGATPESGVEEPGRPLNFHDFNNIFGLKLDLKSAQEIRKKIRVIGPATDVSYPTEVKVKKNDEKNLNLAGHVTVRTVSSDAVVDLLAKGSNIVVPNENNEYVLITLSPQSNWTSKDEFGVSWKTQNDESASCGAVRIPIVVKSNELFYSKKGTDFFNVFKKELEELSQKNKSSVSSNPFHNEVKEKPAEEVQSDSEYHEVSNAQYDFHKETTENQTAKTSDPGSSTSTPANESSEEAPKSDGEEGPLSARQLFNFMNKFKAEMKGEIVDMVEETVKKYSAKDKADGASGSKKDADKRSVINVIDCVKSEADDSDLPNLLNTLSQIEQQLSSIENATNSDMASAKPHKYNMHSYIHGHHRRGRDFSNMTRRATLGILKKRMKGSVVELESDLLAISKSGFKLKMARNVSQSFRFVLFKYGKYRNSKFEADFTPTIVPSGGLECCIKPATKSQDKSQIDDKGQYTFYDVRFKSKERTGKFRCYLKILRNGKVCGNPLCITVRVKRFHSASDQIDSAEEALPCYSGPRANGFGGFDPTSSANVDVDEGISVFQEYPSSPSSDSEDGEATTRENDNDEGIDTKLDASCSGFEKLSINEKRTFSMFDEDSDSSVSLLLDENEVREAVDKEFDSVKIPPCFIPHADMSKEPMSVRVKRKINSARKKKSDIPSAPPKSPTKKKQWWEIPNGNQPMSGTNQATDDTHNNPYWYRRLPREQLPAFNQFLSEGRPSPRFFKGAKDAGNSANKTETASQDQYKPIYPTLDELRETPAKAKKSTASKETQSPVAILPEKVFEMTSNVFKSVMNSMKQPNDMKENMQKNIDETLWSISRSVFGGPPPSAQPPQPPSAQPPQPPSAQPPQPASCAAPPAFCAAPPAFCSPPPASCAAPLPFPPFCGLPPVTGITAPVSSPQPAENQASCSRGQAFCPPAGASHSPQKSCDGLLMTSGNQIPVASYSAPSALDEHLTMPNATTPAYPPQQEQAARAASISQVPKTAFSTATQDSAADIPMFAFPDPRFVPPPSFAPPTNSFPFNIPPQSATIGTNTPNVARTMSAPFFEFADSTRAPNCPAKPTKLEELLVDVQMPCSAGTNVPTTNAVAPPTETLASVHASKSPENKPSIRNGLIAGEEYNRLEPEVRQKILQLNEMGFLNDSYNLFLIRKYPQDMDKVVESLVNYNDF